MTFRDDGGGFVFNCDDAKFSFNASTWGTKLSQIGKVRGTICIMTRMLPDIEYIAERLLKRPRDIFILANDEAECNAKIVKSMFPDVQIALHPRNNAKVVFVEPATVWFSSADFGKSNMDELGIEIKSKELYDKGRMIFNREWERARIL